MKRFLQLLALALMTVVPAVILRIGGWRPNPVLDTVVFGVAVLAAGFMLSWGAEAAEKRISQGLILAGVALVTVLPEYAVDMYYAFQAGKAPDSNYVHYAAANMTGANRLLVGLAWPLMTAVYWWRTRQKAIVLAPVNLVEIGFLLLASVYAFAIVLRNEISAWDTVILIGMFGAYLWATSRLPKVESGLEADDEPGPAAALATLPAAQQWLWMGGLTVVAAAVILASAEPFAESIVASGRVLGIDEFLLIQWLAPLASEAPAVVIAVLFVLSGRPEGGLTTMISDKINQWTLLVGMLPLAMSVGAGRVMSLPLDARQHEEFFLTAAQSLLGVALLMRLRLSLRSAIALVALFSVQIVVAFVYREDAAKAVSSLTTIAWIYLAIAAVIMFLNGPSAWRAAQSFRQTVRNEQLPLGRASAPVGKAKA